MLPPRNRAYFFRLVRFVLGQQLNLPPRHPDRLSLIRLGVFHLPLPNISLLRKFLPLRSEYYSFHQRSLSNHTPSLSYSNFRLYRRFGLLQGGLYVYITTPKFLAQRFSADR